MNVSLSPSFAKSDAYFKTFWKPSSYSHHWENKTFSHKFVNVIKIMFGWDDRNEKQSNGIIIISNYGITWICFFSFICFPFTRSMDMVHNAFEVERVQALRFIRKVCKNSYSGISEQASDYRSSTGWLLWSNSNLLALNKHFTVAYFCQVWPHFKILEKPGYC